MPDDASRPVLTLKEAASAARVSRRTIYKWIEAGKVEVIRTAGGSVRVFTDTLWRAVASKEPRA